MFFFSVLKKKILNNLPLQLLLCLGIGIFFGDFFSDQAVAYIYTASYLIKDLLMLALPVIIISYLLAALVSFEKQAPLLIMAILALVIISNAASVLTAYGVAQFTFPLLKGMTAHSLVTTQEAIHPIWMLGIPPILSPDRALLIGITIGLITNLIPSQALGQFVKKWSFRLRDGTTRGLKRGFIPFLPIYVLGFVLKLDRDGSLGILVQNYGRVFVLSCFLIIAYIALLYAMAARFKGSVWLNFIREMVPAGLTGFSTMSSAATMPVTLAATEKNLQDRSYADFVIPTTVNIHLIGDGLNIALTSLALLVMAGQPLPGMHDYLYFTLYYCLAKFSCAGVPGGGVLVILPVAQTYLGLNPEMTSLLATIYILQDPILTSANVMGNGAFALLTRNFFKAFEAKN